MTYKRENRSSLVELTIVVPCFNEEGSLQTLEKRIREALATRHISYELIFVNDGSSDESSAILKNLEEESEVVKVIHNPSNLGLFRSWLVGVEESTSEFVCLIDADLQNPPEDILRMFLAMKSSGYDVVQAVRSDFERKKGLRFLYSRGLNTLLNILFWDNAKDNKSGFLVARRDVLKAALEVIDLGRFQFPQTFIRVAIARENVSILEVESLFMPRRSGVSFLRGFASIKASLAILFLDLPRAMAYFWPSRYKEKSVLIPKKLKISSTIPLQDLHFARKVLLELYFLTMPIHKWIIRRTARSYYYQLMRSQYFSRDEINCLQEERLRKLLEHAYRSVPYYRRVFRENGFHPSHFKDAKDLSKVPLLSKENVRSNLYFDLFSKNQKKRRLLKIATSGSTGQPFVVYADRFQLEVRFATTLRQLTWTGWQFGDRQVRLWHQRLGMTKSQVFKERIDAFFMRRRFIPAFEITDTNIDDFIGVIEKTNPVLIDGYAESLNFLAGYLKTRKLRASPKAVMSSAQILPEQSRQVIEENLGSRVFDKYGSREFSGIAYECKDSPGLHHVMDESYVLEILVGGRNAVPGEVGEIVITDLNNYSVPLIRYRIGDLAECVPQGNCPCGRQLSQIGKIQGRTQAIVHCQGDLWIPGTFFAHFFKDFDSVIFQFQIFQEIRGSFTLKFIRGSDFTEKSMKDVLSKLKQYIGETTVLLEEVAEIPLLSTGKRSPVVSLINQDFQRVRNTATDA
jgi:phenylacetate-CoA ligase